MIKSLRKNQLGATAIETALVLPIFLFLVFAIVEVSIISFYSFVIEGAMFDATRLAKVATGDGDLAARIRQQILTNTYGLMDPAKLYITTNTSFSPGTGPVDRENCAAADGSVQEDQFCPCGNQFIDNNKDGICNDGGASIDAGNPGDIKEYVVYYQHEVLVPGLFRLARAGSDNSFTDQTGLFVISSATVVRNEPAVQ